MGAHKKLTFLVVALKTRVFLMDALIFLKKVDDLSFFSRHSENTTVTTNAQNTLKRGKHFKGAPVFIRREGGVVCAKCVIHNLLYCLLADVNRRQIVQWQQISVRPGVTGKWLQDLIGLHRRISFHHLNIVTTRV